MTAPSATGPLVSRRPRWRRLLGRLTLAVGSVALFFGLLEGGLRLFGFGHPSRFYRDSKSADGQPILRENRSFVAPWFPEPLVRRPVPFRLPPAKPANGCRIFVLGSSAAMGDPEPSFSIARQLEVMLSEAYPELAFEVVNAALTAINSHVVREIADDCAELDPDFFIVYEGNNEVIGPFGPSGVLTPVGRSRAAIDATIALRRSRTGQLFGALARPRGAGVPEQWAGMEMFLERQFPAGHPALDQVRARFRENLDSIIASGTRAGAPTLLCTVLTNRKDFSPFLSAHHPGLAAAELERWQAHVAAGEQASAAGDPAAAEREFRAAFAIDDRHAALVFRLGRAVLAQQRSGEAAKLLEQAEQLDTLRFRTDASLNAIIVETARRRGEWARLIDLAPVAAAAHPSGIAGDEILYEHVHLNFQGTFLVAEKLFDQISADLAARRRIPAPVKQPVSPHEARVRLAYTVYEQAMIAQKLARRLERPPFTAQFDQAARLALWQQRARHAEELLQQPGNRAPLDQLYQNALKRRPADWILARNSGMARVGVGDPAGALPLLRQAAGFIDDDPDTLFALATALRLTGDDAGAARVFARLRNLEPRFPGLPAK